MQTEKTVTQIQRGVTTNMETGESHVPTPEGGARSEAGGHEDLSYIFSGSQASKKLVEELINKNGLQAEAAAAKGQEYKPTFTSRVSGVLTTQVTPARLVVFTIVGLGTYYLSKWAAKKLASAMGWNLFGNVVGPIDEITNEQPRRAAPPARRQPAPAPFQAPAQA